MKNYEEAYMLAGNQTATAYGHPGVFPFVMVGIVVFIMFTCTCLACTLKK